jgi:MOSC domain-containing protein YiiM
LKVISINIASPEYISLEGGSKKHKSGIFKTPVSEPIFLDYLGFEGDGVGDLKIHGGRDKAICAYCVEHLPFWSKKLQREISPGSFGENLSLLGMPETDINIGDIFDIGSAQVQVSQPRQPCHKLNKVFNDQTMACSVKKSGFSGYYFRVLKTGVVESHSLLKKTQKGSNEFSIEKANALLRKGGSNIPDMEELISIQALSDEWQKLIQKRLSRLKF